MGFSVLLTLAAGVTRASAEPLPASCRTGLVLGISEQDAEDVVVAVCRAAKRRGTPGVVRVSVVGAGPRVRIGVAHLVDTQDVEQTAHTEARDVAEAIRVAPAVLEALDGAPPPPPPPPSPSPSPSPPPAQPLAPAPFAQPRRDEPARDVPPPDEKPASALEAKAGPPAAWIGLHGSSALAGGGAGFGGGAAIGVDHRSAQGFIDYSNSSASPTGEKFEHSYLTMGARLKLSQSAVKPVIGGGWSYVDYDRTHGTSRTRGAGIGVFAEAGVIYAIERHHIMGLARWNIGLYEEKVSAPYSYSRYDGVRVDSYDTRSSDGLASSVSFLAGYGYVFR